MNNDFFKAKEYYLIDTFNGEVKKDLIKFDVIHNSTYKLNNAVEVAIESKTKEFDITTGKEYYIESIYQAFMKSSADSYKDDLDVINSEIAELIDVSASKVYRVETDNNLFGVVNINNKEKDQNQINMDSLVNNLIKLVKEKNVTLTSWLKNYFSLPKTDSNLLLNSEDDVVSVIEMTINTLSVLFRLKNDELENLRKDYIKMIFFDLISNNVDRSFNTYSVLATKEMKFVKLSSIYDYNNDLDNNSYYILNNHYIDKNAVMSCLYHKYYHYIKNVSKGLSDNYGLYMESINLIIDNNINAIYANQVKDNYKANIDTIKSLELIHSRNYLESKLDIAMTQTSINLNALNKNQLVHSKYKNKNKNKPVKVEKVSDIKIKVEPKQRSSKITTVLLVIFGIILFIGIVVGIIFIISNLLK